MDGWISGCWGIELKFNKIENSYNFGSDHLGVFCHLGDGLVYREIQRGEEENWQYPWKTLTQCNAITGKWNIGLEKVKVVCTNTISEIGERGER